MKKEMNDEVIELEKLIVSLDLSKTKDGDAIKKINF